MLDSLPISPCGISNISLQTWPTRSICNFISTGGATADLFCVVLIRRYTFPMTRKENTDVLQLSVTPDVSIFSFVAVTQRKSGRHNQPTNRGHKKEKCCCPFSLVQCEHRDLACLFHEVYF